MSFLKTLKEKFTGPANFPPGVKKAPIVGSLPFLGKDLHKSFTEHSKSLGDVFHVRLGTAAPVVILNGYECIKEAFETRGDDFADRPSITLSTLGEAFGDQGITSQNGEAWAEQREFALSTLHSLENRSIMEKRIMEGAVELVEAFEINDGKAFNPTSIILDQTVNNICAVSFGERYQPQDEEFCRILGKIDTGFTLTSKFGAPDTWPFLKHLPGDPFQAKKYKRNLSEIKAFIQSKIDSKRSEGIQPDSNSFVDAYLGKMKKLQLEETLEDSSYSDEQLASCIHTFYFAGTVSLGMTTSWGLVYITMNPVVQRKLHEEIEQVIGTRAPTIQDRANMPYMVATLAEIDRCACVVPLGVPHATVRDTHIRGYSLPAHTTVIANMHSIHYDPVLFPEPEIFNPDRFLDDSTSLANSMENVLPFCPGKRYCLGASMSRMQAFLFLTSILQRFNLSFENGQTPDINVEFGLALEAPDFQLIAELR